MFNKLFILLLIYLINNNEFDPETISTNLKIEPKEVLTLINSLSKKDIIKLKSITKNNIRDEYISLNELYNKLALLLMKEEEKKVETTIFDAFEKEFGRTLSPMEYEIIGAWLESGFTEELVLLALKEAIYNHVTNLRYIDTILYEWKKKNIKTKEDVLKQKQTRSKKAEKKEIFDYDWLNE